MDYKTIIGSRELRGKILCMFRFISDKPMFELQYRIKLGRKLNFNLPKLFAEKLQWYIINYRNHIMYQSINIFLVRNYLKTKGLEKYLVPLGIMKR